MTFIFHGVFQGIGHGLMFCPAVTMTANYFKGSRWKMMALGLAGCGASVGGMVFPAIASHTINTLGINKTLWIMSGVVTFLSILMQMFSLVGPRKYTPSDGHSNQAFSWKRIVEWKAFGEPCYALYVVAMFFVFIGLWIPFCTYTTFTTLVLALIATLNTQSTFANSAQKHSGSRKRAPSSSSSSSTPPASPAASYPHALQITILEP